MESDLQFYRAVGFNCYVRPLPFFFGQCKLKVRTLVIDAEVYKQALQ